MQLLPAFIAALTLSSGVLAQGWHGCAGGFEVRITSAYFYLMQGNC